jgi:glycosyltransferase involved in cell wall biosynthesis
MDKIKVLVLSNMYPNQRNPGYGIFIHNQNKHLAKAGCRVKVVSPVPLAPKLLWFNRKWKDYGKLPKKELIDGIETIYPRYIQAPGEWFHSYSSFTIYAAVLNYMGSLIKEFKPDLIHAHAAVPSGYAALKLKRKYNLPLVCSLRGSDINVYPRRNKLAMHLTKEVISGADQLVSVSNALRTAAADIATPKREIRVVYNGCDTGIFFADEYRGLQIRQTLRISTNDKVLIFVGSLSKNKGVYELIASFEELFSMYDDIHLLMVGEGPEHDNLSELIAAKGMTDRAHLVGKRSPAEIPEYLSASDFFVLPTYYEGLPNAVLEAMACGLPVIATCVGGIPEAVKDGRNGILIKRFDRASLTGAVKCLYEDKDLAKLMGSSSRMDIERSFSWKRNSEQLIGIYRGLIDARG